MSSVDGRVTAHDGLELADRLYGRGSGRPLVLLHGGGANLVSINQYAERLGADRTVVPLDLRACGQSADPARFRWADAVGDIESLVEALGLGAVDIVGHSMGGFVAAFCATEHPDTRIVSIDGFGPGMPTIGDDKDRAAFAVFQSGMKAAFWSMTEQRDEGDRAWRDAQVEALVELFPRLGIQLRTPERWQNATWSTSAAGGFGATRAGCCSKAVSPTVAIATSCACTDACGAQH